MTPEALINQDQLSHLSGLPHDLGRWSEAVLACESLALLSARTILASSLHKASGSAHFPPTINIHSVGLASDVLHPTTTSQCITALQTLIPKIRRFRPGISVTSRLPFQIAGSLQGQVKPDELYQDLFRLIEESFHALGQTLRWIQVI
jgi:hypothetical protein